MIACVLQAAGTYGIVQGAAINYIYDVGTCETLIAVAEDIKIETTAFHEPIKTKADEIKLKERLGAFIEFHIKGIELSPTLF